MARLTLEDIEAYASPEMMARIRNAVAEQTGCEKRAQDAVTTPASTTTGGWRKSSGRAQFSWVSEDSRKRVDSLNKTEARFYKDHLLDPLVGKVVVQPPRFFELTGGGTYTPDFLVITGSYVDVYEIKGHYMGPGWEQGIERYKRAAAEHSGPYVRFCLAEWVRSDRKWVLTWWRDRAANA